MALRLSASSCSLLLALSCSASISFLYSVQCPLDVHCTANSVHCTLYTEPEFVKRLASSGSIPRNRFRQPM
jgi:hypothetical protein